jgi:hypothetical protein
MSAMARRLEISEIDPPLSAESDEVGEMKLSMANTIRKRQFLGQAAECARAGSD